MGFTELKEKHKCAIAYEVNSKQRRLVSSLLAQKLLKDVNISKFEKVKSIIYLMNHITDQYSENSLDQHSNCFLKSCFFCHKAISQHKEVYIYRGELGFCSADCRNKQIYLDELKKVETYTKKMLASLVRQRRRGAGRCRQNIVASEDFQQHGKPSSSTNQVTFTIS
ncbi:hypothetical protein P3L10_018346 [Capsicum annuum]|uniref:uncharacterized protein LOC107874824 n=1 Tax=Capsicum annuum TaxID=4072 RepID=UPI0007BFA152|nr:uncharacterized protein LOC107874824 [Capsicum annuum]